MKSTKFELLEIIANVKLDYANWRKLNLAYVELGQLDQETFDKLDQEYREITELRIARFEQEMHL